MCRDACRLISIETASEYHNLHIKSLKIAIGVPKTVSESKKKDKDQESIQSSTTPDPGYQWESDNFTIRHNKRKPRGQPIPAGDHKASINRRTRKLNKNKTEIT